MAADFLAARVSLARGHDVRATAPARRSGDGDDRCGSSERAARRARRRPRTGVRVARKAMPLRGQPNRPWPRLRRELGLDRARPLARNGEGAVVLSGSSDGIRRRNPAIGTCLGRDLSWGGRSVRGAQCSGAHAIGPCTYATPGAVLISLDPNSLGSNPRPAAPSRPRRLSLDPAHRLRGLQHRQHDDQHGEHDRTGWWPGRIGTVFRHRDSGVRDAGARPLRR